MLSYIELETAFIDLSEKKNFAVYIYKTGHLKKEIDTLEKEIGIHLSNDYKVFLSKYRAFSIDDQEFAPIDLKHYAKTINRLRECREEMGTPIADNMYALGEFDPECPIYLQDSNGKVYKLNADYKYSNPELIADSFLEFINKWYEYAKKIY